MIAPSAPPPALENFAELLAHLGGISPERIRLRPPPGSATEQDVLEVHRQSKRLCELVDGVLVEKPMRYRESLLAVALSRYLHHFVRDHNLGLVAGEAGMVRLFPGLVRIPDVSFVSWSRLPHGRVPKEPIPDLVPDFAIEVLSPSNTLAEMKKKRRGYFSSGMKLVWEVDPDARTVTVYTAPEQATTHAESEILDGGAVLPGFTLALRDLFAELDQQSPKG